MITTNRLLNALRGEIVDRVAAGQYKIGNTYTTVSPINRVLNTDGTVTCSFTAIGSPGDTVTEFRLIDSGGNVLASRAENIELSDVYTAVYYLFTFTVEEEE